MGFTTPAFIRKNTPELRKKLGKLGYNHSTDVIEDERFCIATSPVNCNYHVILKEVLMIQILITHGTVLEELIVVPTKSFSWLSLH